MFKNLKKEDTFQLVTAKSLPFKIKYGLKTVRHTFKSFTPRIYKQSTGLTHPTQKTLHAIIGHKLDDSIFNKK